MGDEEYHAALGAGFAAQSPGDVVKPLFVSGGAAEAPSPGANDEPQHGGDDNTIARVNSILAEAGFEPMPEGPLAGALCKSNGNGGYVFGGVQREIGEVHAWGPELSARTTNDPIEAALKLAAYVETKRPRPDPVVLSGDDLTLEPVRAVVMEHEAPAPFVIEEAHETPIPESQEADGPAEEHAYSVGGGDGDSEAQGAEDLGSADDGPTGGGLALYDDAGQDEPGDRDRDYAFDADFEEAGDEAELEGDLGAELLLDDQSEPAREAEAPAEEVSSGVAYFGDDIHVARLAKMGRLLEIATERKAALQEGWTVAEFASLQNLIMRINQGEAPDDVRDRERFDQISAYSRAMSHVDAFLALREAELERYAKPLDREAILAFNPEAGWP